METDFQTQAEVVVIGGGVIGCAVAWQLTRLGCGDVLVLEKGRIGCGTTWHSAGNIIRMNTDPVTIEIFSESARVVRELATRHELGWRNCGRIMLARTEHRLEEFQGIVSQLACRGVEVHEVSADEARDKIPLLNTDDVLGALWSPGDGRVDPYGLTEAYRKEAREAGAGFVEGVSVQGTRMDGNRVRGVVTSQGEITCDNVVNCAGMWARELGLKDGIDIPLYAVEHFYALTETIEGTYPEMPTFRDPDGLIYGREEVGGLLFGCFDRNALPLAISDLPEPFEFALLEENWDQFMPYMEQAVHRIPALETAGIRSLVNGPESFTPDAEPHLSRAPGVDNYYVLAGLSSSGVTRSGGMAGAIARWIVDGDPGLEVSQFSLDRFSPGHNTDDYLRDRIRHVPAGHFTLES